MERVKADDKVEQREPLPPQVDEPQANTISMAEISGRMQEYQDLNAMLTTRLSIMRGELTKRDATIAELQQALIVATKSRKGNGRG